ncbi:MAG TPA: DUF418 domain-containing protein [Gemmatimonadaceae bacterium]|nr:DUF418 domain-containing protein [Gemmatimonadaceae bacterium]
MTEPILRAGAPAPFTPMAPAPEPLAERARIGSLDVLRGAALLGILVMNIQAFSMPGAAYMNPTAYGDLGGANWLVWLGGHLLFDQKMMAIFTMLFGAGILIFAGKGGDPARALSLHRRRMLWLLLFGLLHAHLFWYGDILFSYAVVGLLAYRFRDRPPTELIRKGIIILCVAPFIGVAIGLSMRYWPTEAVAQFAGNAWAPSDSAVAREVGAYRGGWTRQAAVRTPTAFMFETIALLIFVGWRVWGVMLLGMALLKLGILDGTRPPRSYARMAALGFGIGVPLVALGVWLHHSTGWNARYSMFFIGQINYFASIPVALGWIGLVLLAYTTRTLTGLTTRLAAVGRMAFTNYILQTLICITIFYGHAFGLFGSVARVGQIGIVVAIWVLQLVLSPIWLRHFQYGPLEWAWRSLTYGSRQPLKRATPLAVA